MGPYDDDGKGNAAQYIYIFRYATSPLSRKVGIAVECNKSRYAHE